VSVFVSSKPTGYSGDYSFDWRRVSSPRWNRLQQDSFDDLNLQTVRRLVQYVVVFRHYDKHGLAIVRQHYVRRHCAVPTGATK